MNKLLYKLQSGKNNKYSYYLKHFLCYLIPQTFYLYKLDRTLQKYPNAQTIITLKKESIITTN